MESGHIALKRKKSIRLTGNDLFFVVTIYIILAIIFVVTIYPMLFVLSAAVSDADAVSTGKLILMPVGFSLNGYKYIFRYQEIWTGYANTVFYTFLGTFLNLLVTLPCAYALTRKEMPGRGFMMALFIITMYFNGGLVPSYLNIKSLGLLNTRTVMLVGGLVSTYNLIVCRTFFASISKELQEAARIDGCNDFRIFLRIIMPLAKPITVVMILYYGVGHWNSYFGAMIYLNDRLKFPLQLFLREILVQSQLTTSALMSGDLDAAAMAEMLKVQNTLDVIKYCVIVVSTAPMLMIYPFLQKFFEKGVMIGSVKG